ncbi:hypothetical protein V6N12_050575 [Hibiscus sabdariffa]|uniref:Secreted protein n=1 Tax=Hibiscus sabdariffa TaxID=183260 RepID=A0ABR2GEI7_9ROSI
MRLPFFWQWLRWWCEPVVCLLPPGAIGGYGNTDFMGLAPLAYLPRCAPISLRLCVRLCGHCVAEFWTAAVRPPGPFG